MTGLVHQSALTHSGQADYGDQPLVTVQQQLLQDGQLDLPTEQRGSMRLRRRIVGNRIAGAALAGGGSEEFGLAGRVQPQSIGEESDGIPPGTAYPAGFQVPHRPDAERRQVGQFLLGEADPKPGSGASVRETSRAVVQFLQ